MPGCVILEIEIQRHHGQIALKKTFYSHVLGKKVIIPKSRILYDLILPVFNLIKSADLVKEKLVHPSVTLSENVNYLVYTVAVGARGVVDTDKSAE